MSSPWCALYAIKQSGTSQKMLPGSTGVGRKVFRVVQHAYSMPDANCGGR